MIISKKRRKISTSDTAERVFRSILDARGEEDMHKEMFYVMGLNADNLILFVDLIALGTVNQTNPNIRECLRLALIKNAIAIIVCHNHPSGRVEPSPQDRSFTKELFKACKIMQVKLLDHIIVGEESFYSFADQNQLTGV